MKSCQALSKYLLALEQLRQATGVRQLMEGMGISCMEHTLEPRWRQAAKGQPQWRRIRI